MAAKIQVRRDTGSEWTTNNPILGIGEQGWEIDTNKLKFGDGVTSWTSLAYFAEGSSYAGMAAEILASASKSTLVNSDLLGIVDSEDNNLLKQFSWINVKLNLSDYFDTLYNPIIASSDDIIEGSINLYNKIPIGGTSNQVLSKNSATDYDLSWVDDSGGIEEAPVDGTPYSRQDAGWVGASSGGGGGYATIQDDGVSLPQQEILNIIGALIEDNAVDSKTKLTLLYSLLNDVDTTGIINGDLMQYNSASGKHEPVNIAPFDDLLSASEAVTAVGLSSLFSKANYSIVGIRIESTTGTGTLNIGTTNGGSEIASVADITGLNDVIEINARYFSDVNDTDIYLTGFTGNFTFYLLTIKGGFSDLPGGVVSLDAYTALTYGATVTWDALTGLNKTLTSTGDFILSITNLSNGMSGDLRINATSDTDITLPTSLLNGTVTGLNGVYHLTWVYDGTNLEFNIADYA